MKREAETNRIAGVVRARDKLHEYSVGEASNLPLPKAFFPSKLFPIAVGFLGDFAAEKVSYFIGVSPGTETSLNDVAFAAKTFLAYANSRIDEPLREELVLYSAAAFHLIDMPGVSLVQASRLSKDGKERSYLDRVLIWLLVKPWFHDPPICEELWEVGDLVSALCRHYRNGASRAEFSQKLLKLRSVNYDSYGDRALLIADVISAVIICRFENSSRLLLHKFAKTEADAWTSYLKSESAVQELWPSQRKLGDAGVLAGASAVVQMPTSAGKTKATELILRTAFAAGRAKLAIVVAPFVALCDEIHQWLSATLVVNGIDVGRLSDALQLDYSMPLWGEDADEEEKSSHVLVITPEKLLYILRQKPELASLIDLVIYDEGHQFDSGARGVTYELLLTSIKARLERHSQTILISAVIQNADVLSEWLLGSKNKVVVDTSNQTQRSIGFTSKASSGLINFISNSDSEPAFAVPGIWVKEQLQVRGREKARDFPAESDSKSVALYLGLNLLKNGGVAIFCGKKDSASALLKYALDVFSRKTLNPPPSKMCDEAELNRFINLYVENFGESYLTASARLGIFSHTSATPRGIRTAIEHAMRNRLLSFVTCTSTLAQGVNLPIKYLLVLGTQQGKESIRVRDFKNLMGRAGRAGMHEEGAVIFCDTNIFDDKKTLRGSKKWRAANQLISPDSRDPVGSSLLLLVLPFKNRFGENIPQLRPIEIGFYLLSSAEGIKSLINELKGSFSNYKLDGSEFREQLQTRLELLNRLQSHVMASAADVVMGEQLRPHDLATKTLAYHLASTDQRADLIRLFVGVSEIVSAKVPSIEKQVRYGKNLLGALLSLNVDEWIEEKFDEISECKDENSLADILWPLLISSGPHHRLWKCEPFESFTFLFSSWLAGKPYGHILEELSESGATYPWGEVQRRKYDIDDVVELCEKLFGFELPLILTAINSSIIAYGGNNPGTRRTSYLLDSLQKRIKYGLPNQNCVSLFEAGFSDRVVAQKIERQIWGKLVSKESISIAINDWQADVEEAVNNFPSHFRSVFLDIVAGRQRNVDHTTH